VGCQFAVGDYNLQINHFLLPGDRGIQQQLQDLGY